MMMKLMKVLALALLASGMTGKGYAMYGEPLPNFSQLCITDESAGFQWREGEWRFTKFIPEKFVVTKVPIPKKWSEENSSAYAFCSDFAKERDDFSTETFSLFSSCLSLQDIGDDHISYTPCYESHRKRGDKVMVQFACYEDNFFFVPNGLFHRGAIPDDPTRNPRNDYKDSLSVSVGKCANISN